MSWVALILEVPRLYLSLRAALAKTSGILNRLVIFIVLSRLHCSGNRLGFNTYTQDKCQAKRTTDVHKKRTIDDDRNVIFTIDGEPASKANSRRVAKWGNKIAFIKSKKAIDYLATFREQCPRLDPLFTCDVAVTICIYYASRRPDLDESLILDAMQGLIYGNDRQVKSKSVQWNLDREHPRASISVGQYASNGAS